MNIRKILSLSLVVLLLLGLLAGCGGAAKENGAVAEDSIYDRAPGAESDNALSSGTGGNKETVTPQNQKLIRTVYMDAETEDMEALLSAVESRIAQLNGYVEARNIYNGSMYNSKRYRNADLTIRIPAESLDQFTEQVSQVSNVTSTRETTEDVTLQYVSIESRIAALETEQTRLLELLAKAETMDDLLTIESRLTDVRYELENINSQLRVYDNKVNYATIYLDISEVVEYTEPTPDNPWQRMGKGFMDSLKGLGVGIREFFIFLVIALPYLALIAGVVIVIILLIKRRKKKKQRQP